MELVTLQLVKKTKDQMTSLANMSSSTLRGFEFYRERRERENKSHRKVRNNDFPECNSNLVCVGMNLEDNLYLYTIFTGR